MKIFNISFHRNATTSFHNFMSQSGYKSMHDVNTAISILGFNNIRNNNIALEQLLKATSKHQVFSDNPWPILYNSLDKHFDDAKFILFHRDPEKWYNSIEKYFGDTLNPFRKFLYKNNIVSDNKDFYKQTYIDHNNSVINYFKDSNKLLIIDLEKDCNIHKLIYDFIDHDGKKSIFPFNKSHSYISKKK